MRIKINTSLNLTNAFIFLKNEFNQCLILPHLTRGWGPLGDYYQITEPSLISFTHLGGSIFQIHIFHGPVQTNEYPSYHRLTTFIKKNPGFVVFVLDIDNFGPKLVSSFYFNYFLIFLTNILYKLKYYFH